jgi:hypothetical protein
MKFQQTPPAAPKVVDFDQSTLVKPPWIATLKLAEFLGGRANFSKKRPILLPSRHEGLAALL